MPFVRGSAPQALLAVEAGRPDDAACDSIRALVDALDKHIPEPARDLASPFLMPIKGVVG